MKLRNGVSCAIVAGLIAAGGSSPAKGQPALERLERKLADDDSPPRDDPPVDDEIDDDADEPVDDVAPDEPADESTLDLRRPDPGYLGAVLDGRGTIGRGVEVVEVLPGSPAADAGLLPGDLVTAVDGRRVRQMDELAGRLQPLPPGTNVTLGIVREGRQQRIEVLLGRHPPPGDRPFDEFGPVAEGEAPDDDGDNPRPPRRQRVQLGLSVRALDDDTRERLELDDSIEGGLLVTEIVLGSPADQAGIPLQAVILSVDGEGVAVPADLAERVAGAAPGDELQVEYYSRGKRSEATLVLAAAPQAPRPAENLGPPIDADPGPVLAPADPPDDEAVAERLAALERTIERLLQRIERLEERLETREE